MSNGNGQVRQVAKKLAHSIRFKKLIGVLVVAIVILSLLFAGIEKEGWGTSIYFAVTTVAGVGYGDVVPMTEWGRVIAMLLQVFGVVLFGSLVAFVSVELTRYQEEFENKRVIVRLEEMQKKMEEMKKHLDYLVKK